ncbi:helix-turn-helix domain-containing protein [Priestia megaterium]
MDNSINVSIDMAPIMERLKHLEQRLTKSLDSASSAHDVWNNCPPLMSVKQTAEFLGISESQVYILTRRQGFPKTKALGGLKITTHMLKIWIERNTEWVEENTDFFNKNVM